MLSKKSNGPISAYLHIPFCQHICYYCDFNKVFLEGQPVDEYIEKMLLEIDLMKAAYPSEAAETLFIGGGTPTALTAMQLDRLLAGVSQRLPLTQKGEFTVEANPGDLDLEKLRVLKNYGVNRLSLGVQSFDNAILKKIGRKHTAEEVYQTMGKIRKAGFDNVSIDLIYALPGQTLASFKETLTQALALDLPHYSLYSLILENKTLFHNMLVQGRLQLPGEDAEGDMFQMAMEAMVKGGRKQYEVSNFAIPGWESRHNLVYWNNGHYYGFGAGASGYLGSLRYKNHGPIQHYLAPLRQGELPIYEKEYLTQKNQMEEEMFLGLRKQQGVSCAGFQEKFGVSLTEVYGAVLPRLFDKGWLAEEAGHLKLTEAGLFLGNLVFEEFLLED